MSFLTWHLLAICIVMAISFIIGYSVAAKKQNRRNYGKSETTLDVSES